MLPAIKINLTCMVAFLASLFILTVPVYTLNIFDIGNSAPFTVPIGSGESFVLRFIHSVERTPVESEYRIASEKIVHWEERFVSHNAGLPTEAPRNGSFILEREWMILRGVGLSARSIRYRVGDDELGRNLLYLPDGTEILLFEEYPRQILCFSAGTTNILISFINRFFRN